MFNNRLRPLNGYYLGDSFFYNSKYLNDLGGISISDLVTHFDDFRSQIEVKMIRNRKWGEKASGFMVIIRFFIAAFSLLNGYYLGSLLFYNSKGAVFF